MRVLLQRVSEASVQIEDAIIARIGPGCLLLAGVTHSDTEAEARWLAEKIAGLRIFEDAEGKMNCSIAEVEDASFLVVSQFTLYGDTRKGRRPSWIDAARPELAEPLVERFAELLREISGLPVWMGKFGAMMRVHLVNDGPVTLMLERDASNRSE